QHGNGRCPEIVEVDTQKIEKPDFLQTINGDIHAHQSGNGTRGADQRYLAPHGEGGKHQAGKCTAYQVSDQISARAHSPFNGKTEQEQKHQVANDVAPATVQKLVSNEGVQRHLRRHQPQLKGAHAADPLLLYGAPLLQPPAAFRRCPDDVPIVLQVLVELPIQ